MPVAPSVVRSTAGTAPLVIRAGNVTGTVYVFQDTIASPSQAYPIDELLAALRAACPEGVSA